MKPTELNALRYEPAHGDTDAGLRRRPTPDFNPEWKVIELPPPIVNHDLVQVVKEMRENHRLLEDPQILRIRWEDREDVEAIFIKALEEMGFRVPKTVRVEAEKLSEQLATIGLHFKDKFKRIRPNRWLEANERTFRFPEAITGKSPSYPSNHALIGAFLGDWFAKKYPRAAEAMEVLGKQVGWNRVSAGFHFPDDYGMGRVLARKLWPLYRGEA
jgi:acid phosphatase (class A)